MFWITFFSSYFKSCNNFICKNCSKKANDSQWWELYDQKTRRYYYYCAGTQTTVWRKPKDSEIIPLARLQVGWTQPSQIVRESPGYRGSLAVSSMGHHISQIGRKALILAVFLGLF